MFLIIRSISEICVKMFNIIYLQNLSQVVIIGDKTKKHRNFCFDAFCVVPRGFEPRLREPKSPVLPLYYGTILLLLKTDLFGWFQKNWRIHKQSPNCCPGMNRTLAKRTRIFCTTIILQGNPCVHLRLFLICSAKVLLNF